jgi:hypothetical protein
MSKLKREALIILGGALVLAAALVGWALWTGRQELLPIYPMF